MNRAARRAQARIALSKSGGSVSTLPAGEPLAFTGRSMAVRLDAPDYIPAVVVSCKLDVTRAELAQELRTLADMLERE